jgi:RHH-type proline utilization regulon transcriptional repressor/proline dehydrogenase/delta 1-pyrroline-5-carboxylate dehydrogenase
MANTSQSISRQSSLAGQLDALLGDSDPDPESEAPLLAQQAVHLPKVLQRRAAAQQTSQEAKQQQELERIMRSPHDKATLVQMTDQGLRSKRAVRAADQLIHILDVQGVPRFFSRFDRALLTGFRSFGAYLPAVAIPMVKEKMREETANVILPAEEEHLLPHLGTRHEAGVLMNLNLLGEALLGEGAVENRIQIYLAALQRPEIECVAVKISTLYSQISPLAWENTAEILCDRLELLYLEAGSMRFIRRDGSEVSMP